MKNMIHQKNLILITIFVFITGCVTTTKVAEKRRPASGAVSAPDLSDEYPASLYLTATGIGQTEREARRLAIAELSNIFEARVMSDVSNSVKSVIGQDSEERVTKTAQQSVRVVSDLNLKGVQIGKVWYDDAQRSHYALAVLNRKQAKDNWSREILDIDGMAEAAIDAMKFQKSAFTRLQLLKKVRQLWLEREVIASRLRVLGFSAAAETSYDIRQVFFEMQEIKTELLIYISAGEGKYSRLTAGQITEKLGKEGFVLTDIKSGANIIISCSVTVEPLDLPGDDFEFARARASLSIIDAATGLTVGKVTENKRSGHLRYSEAANKAVAKVSEALSGKLIVYFSE